MMISDFMFPLQITICKENSIHLRVHVSTNVYFEVLWDADSPLWEEAQGELSQDFDGVMTGAFGGGE